METTQGTLVGGCMETAFGWIAVAVEGCTIVEALIAGTEHDARRLMLSRRPSWSGDSVSVPAIVEAHSSGSGTDVRLAGTEFQMAVWRALLEIPSGEVRTYSQVAAAIGKPKSFRAVANACAANRIAVFVPCHRVVPRGGDVGGYAWGREAKRKLLELESRRA